MATRKGGKDPEPTAAEKARLLALEGGDTGQQLAALDTIITPINPNNTSMHAAGRGKQARYDMAIAADKKAIMNAMPNEDSLSSRRARRKSRIEQQRRSGRLSTVLTGESAAGTLGG